MQLVHLLTFPAGIILAVFVLSISAASWNIWMFFNSDTLYLPSIYIDLLADRSGIQGWHLNSAPNFFPDMAIYFVMMALLKKITLTSFFFSILQITLLMVLINRFLKSIDPDFKLETLILVNFSILLLLFSAASGENLNFPFQILIPSYHCGFFINVFLAAIPGFHYIRTGKPFALVVTAVVVMLAILSDRIFLIGFVFPLLIVGLVSVLKKNSEKRYFLLMAVVVFSCLFGLQIFKWMEKSQVVFFFSTAGKMYAFENMTDSFHNLMKHMAQIIREYPLQRWLVIFSFLFALVAPVYLIYHLVSFFKDRLDTVRKNQYRLTLFLFVFTLSIFFIPVINGYYPGPAAIRYNFSALIIGSAGFFYLLQLFFDGFGLFRQISKYLILVLSGVLLILILRTWIHEDISGGVRSFINHYPDKSRVLDSLKEPYGLKYGLSNYWHAKHSTYFSKKGIRVYSVHDEDLKPYYHVTNQNWYHDGGKGAHANPVFNFVYADNGWDTSGILNATFGQLMDTIYNQEGKIVIKLPDFKIDRVSREMFLLDHTGEP